jgi:hypothetical protein
MPPIPESFTPDGVLEVGTYGATLDEVRASILVVGPPDAVALQWDGAHRRKLVDSAEILIKQLWQVGLSEIFLDGSFAEAKPHPNDIDGYFECDLALLASGELQRQLNALDPHKVWTWDPASRRIGTGSTKRQLPMWHRYRVELYPHLPGLLSGIKDGAGHELQFPAAFRRQRGSGVRKGIIQVVSSHGTEAP